MRLEDLTKTNEQYKAAEKAIEDAFQNIEDTCTVDGTNLTDNQEIKFRRTRLVSEVRPHKKSIHGKDFINYCEFLTGKRESCSKPKGIFNQVLSLIRNNKPEFIIPSYRGIVNNYFDLITKAAEIKPRIAKQMIEQNTNEIQIENKETNMQKKLEKLKEKKTNKNSEKAAQKFETWLKQNLDFTNSEKPIDKKYCGWVSYYLKHHRQLPSYWPNVAKEIMDKHYSELLNMTPCKGVLIPNNAVNSIRLASASAKSKMPKSTEEPIIVTSATNPKFDIPSDTLSKLIIMAKNAGATEITIKL